jgi:hypothetical protein
VTVDSVGPHGLGDLAMNRSVSGSSPPLRSRPTATSASMCGAFAVDLGEPLDGAGPLIGQPEPEHLLNLEHTYLPARHGRLSRSRYAARFRSAAPALVDPGEVVA